LDGARTLRDGKNTHAKRTTSKFFGIGDGTEGI
jgi:hypothetical protein